MEKRITILFVIESLGVGGAEKALVQTVNSMPQFRKIVVILHAPDILRTHLTDAELINLNCHSISDRVKAVRHLRKIIKNEKVDLVHAQLFNSSLVARLASRGTTPFVFTLQSMLGEDLFQKNIVARLAERFTYSHDNYIIAVSQEALNDYKKYIKTNPENETVIYNSIEEKFFAPSYKPVVPGKKLRMLAVGNLKPLKNHGYLLEALKSLPADFFELDIYGEGVDRDNLQTTIDTYNLPARLMGNVSDLDKRMKTYDLYLHCSKYEGSSLAVFEAMASGLPQVVSDIPVLIENTGGFATYVDLANPGDLAEKLDQIRTGERNINENGAKGFNWVKSVAHPDISRDRTLEVYDKILATKQKSN